MFELPYSCNDKRRMTVVRTGNIATSIGNCEDTLTDDCGLLYTCRYVHMLTRRKEVERKLQSSVGRSLARHSEMKTQMEWGSSEKEGCERSTTRLANVTATLITDRGAGRLSSWQVSRQRYWRLGSKSAAELHQIPF